MIDIPMRTKGALDSSSLDSINSTLSRPAINSQNIMTLNQPLTGHGPAVNYTAPNYASPNQQTTYPDYQNQQTNNPGFSGQNFQNQQNTSPAFSSQSFQNQQNTSPAFSSQSFQNQQNTSPVFSSQGFQNQQNTSPAFSSQGFQNQQNVNTAPVQRHTPVLQKPVQKGQKVALSAAPLSTIEACLGWNTTNSQCDIDVSAFMLGDNGKVIGDSWFVFYGQTKSPDNSTQFFATVPNDCEAIQINLHTLNPAVKKIVFVLTINEAFEKKLNFSMVKDAYIRIMDKSTNTELVSFKMTEYYSNVVSMMIGEIYNHNGTWKFNAIGNGVAKDLAGLCELYGVQVI